VASYAAAIKEHFNEDVEIETGCKGQFDVLVSEKTVVSRKGGLLALLFRKPWPTNEEVITAIDNSAQ
jgi:hypothetical protein